MKQASKKKMSSPMNIQCVWGLLCSSSSIDQESNNISLFNVIDQVNVPRKVFEKNKEEKKTVFVNPQHQVVLLFRRTLNLSIDGNELIVDMKLKTIDPEGNVLQEVISPLRLTKKARRLYFRMNMKGFVVTTPGDYIHRVEIKEPDSQNFSLVKQIPFEVLEKPSTK